MRSPTPFNRKSIYIASVYFRKSVFMLAFVCKRKKATDVPYGDKGCLPCMNSAYSVSCIIDD